MATESEGPRDSVEFPHWKHGASLGIAYVLFAEAGRRLSVPDSTYISFWLPAALYVAVLLLNERRAWPALVVGAFAGNVAFDLLHGTPAAAAALFSLANTVQATTSAWLVRRYVADRPALVTLKELTGFLGFAAVLGSAVGATAGAATLVSFGFSHSFLHSWKLWWGSNAMAILLLSPFILTWFTDGALERVRRARPARMLEAAAAALLLFALTWHLLAAGGGVMAPDKGRVVLPLLWAGLRFGPQGAAAASLLLAVPIAYFTTQHSAGLTPAQVAAGDYVFVMQVALALAALVALIPAVVLAERDQGIRELRESEARLRLSVHASNIGLWDWDIVSGRLYYSPEWKSQLGYGEHELADTYETWRSRLHPDDRERILPAVRSYVSAPAGSFESEYRLRHKDGSYRWIHSRAQVETDASGRPVRMLGCHIDVTARKAAEERLRQSLVHLQELSRRLVEVEEAERRSINRELHDRVGQNLSALNLSLNLVRSQLPPAVPEAVRERLNDAQELTESAVRQIRDVMADLRPPALDDYGLLAALRTYVEPYSARLGVPVSVRGVEPAPRLPATTETALFRIAQEALTNAAKHARPTRIEVALATWNGRVRLAVSDDGAGFEEIVMASGSASWGLKTMRERAEAVGARLRVESAPGQGTAVVVEVEHASS